jgi:hypothetical protein
VIRIYLAKIFMETKDRPYTIVRAEYSHPAAGTIEDHAPLVASTERAGQSSHDSATPRPVRP